jgi:hypothetical protein
MRIIGTLSILALLAAGAAVAQEPSDEARIKKALEGLGAESFEEREKATSELRKIGTPALDALRKQAEKSSDPEVRVRAKRLVEEIEKGGKKKDPMRRGGAGARISIRQADGETVYIISSAGGEDAIELRKSSDGKVKLAYPDGKGGKSEASSDSLEKFLSEHKALAEKYGITKDGIDYAGTRLKFGEGFPAFPKVPRLEFPDLPEVPKFPGLDEWRWFDEDLEKTWEEFRRLRPEVPGGWDRRFFGAESVIGGARIGPVPELLRSHLAIPEGQGVVVESVREGTTAAAAGLKRHDVVLEIDGKKVAGPADVRARLTREATLKVLRAGKEEILKPAPAERKSY